MPACPPWSEGSSCRRVRLALPDCGAVLQEKLPKAHMLDRPIQSCLRGAGDPDWLRFSRPQLCRLRPWLLRARRKKDRCLSYPLLLSPYGDSPPPECCATPHSCGTRKIDRQSLLCSVE